MEDKSQDSILNNLLKEDLAVWFGTKKKPKGSKQPKGPWVNICRKKEGGGHPPCGRPEADSKGYPKCRAAGVASKISWIGVGVGLGAGTVGLGNGFTQHGNSIT